MKAKGARIALLSDIHGNLVSLEAVLTDVQRQRVDQIVCLGDVATMGPQPREVLARLRALDCVCVRGNHDVFLLDPDSLHAYTDDPWVVEMIDWCRSRLVEADFDDLRSFRPEVEIPLDANQGITLLCFHGSPRSDTDLILATTPTAELDPMLAGRVATVLAGGHTHVPMVRQHKGTMIVNPGSVGAPLEQVPFEDAPRMLPRADYAIVTWIDGVIGVELRRVPVDVVAITQAALSGDIPRAEDWVASWVKS